MAVTSHNVVVLGASYAGSSAAHIFLKHILPQLPGTGAKYRVYLINPSKTFYHRSASPRAAASLQLTKNIKMFCDIPSGFSQYGSESFTFMHGSVIAMNTEQRTVEIELYDGHQTSIQYHALVLATGTSTYAPVLNTYHTSLEELQSTISRLNMRISSAKSIIISGGGPSAVELAGEIGEHLNGVAGRFSERPDKPRAKVTVIAGAAKLLPILGQRFSDWADSLLKRVGVDVIYSRRTTTIEERSDGGTTVNLDNGETMECDVFIPAMGVRPNTAFVPRTLLDEKGFIKTNAKTLRVDDAGPRVYCFGDVGNYTRGGLIDLIEAVPVGMTNLKRDLLAAHFDFDSRPTGPDMQHKSIAEETQLIPVGQSRGLGAFCGFKLPYIMTYHFKVKDYFDCGHEFASGARWVKTKI
jgi:apoptosis-inducing factor 2